MRLLITNRRAGIVNRRAVTTEGGAPCCCGIGPPNACACYGLMLVRGCGVGNWDGGDDYFSECCKVPPNYDLSIDGNHSGEQSAEGGANWYYIDPLGTRTEYRYTQPGLVYSWRANYTLRLKVRCVGSQRTYDYTGSRYDETETRAVRLSDTTFDYITTTRNLVDQAAFDFVAVLLSQSLALEYHTHIYAGVVPFPLAFAFSSREFIGMGLGPNPQTLCNGGHVGPRVATNEGIAGGYRHSTTDSGSNFNARSRCTDGNFGGSGSSYARGETVQVLPGFGYFQNETFKRLGSDSVTWDRNDNVVQQDPCGVVPECQYVPKTGACCLSTVQGTGLGGGVNTCAQVTEAECGRRGGAYRGDGTGCATLDQPCPKLGRCCLPDGTCTHTTDLLCALRQGVYAGDGTTCAGPTPCLPPVWACCAGGFCADLTEAQCQARNGTWRIGVLCATEQCDNGGTGSCCLVDGTCIDGVTQQVCAAKEGRFSSLPCSGRQCPRRDDTVLPGSGNRTGGCSTCQKEVGA